MAEDKSSNSIELAAISRGNGDENDVEVSEPLQHEVSLQDFVASADASVPSVALHGVDDDPEQGPGLGALTAAAEAAAALGGDYEQKEVADNYTVESTGNALIDAMLAQEGSASPHATPVEEGNVTVDPEQMAAAKGLEFLSDFDCGRPPFVPIPTHVGVVATFVKYNAYVIELSDLKRELDDPQSTLAIQAEIAATMSALVDQTAMQNNYQGPHVSPIFFRLSEVYDLYQNALLQIEQAGRAFDLLRWGYFPTDDEVGSAAEGKGDGFRYRYDADIALANAAQEVDPEKKASTEFQRRLNSSIADQKAIRTWMEQTKIQRYSNLSACERCCARWDDWWQENVTSQKHLVPLFRTSLDKIESRFGPSTASYFFFARSVFWLNVFIALLALGVIIPGLIESDWSTDYTVRRFVNNQFTLVPATRDFTGVIFGKGMEDSFLFYSEGYPPTLLRDEGYRVDIAWVFVVTAVFVVSVIDSLSRFELSTDDRDDANANALRLVFGSFSYNKRTASEFVNQSVHMSSAMYTLMLTKEEDERHETTAEVVGTAYYALKLRRFTGYLFSAAVMVGSCVLIAYLVLEEDTIRVNAQDSLAQFAELIVPVSISGLKLFVPFVLRQLVFFENYARTKDIARHVALRIYFMKMFFVLIVLFQTLSLSGDELRDGICPQTIMGILYYRLFMTDIVVDMLCSVGIPLATYYAARLCNPCREFNPEDYRDDAAKAIEKAKKRTIRVGCCASPEDEAEAQRIADAGEGKANTVRQYCCFSVREIESSDARVTESDMRRITELARYVRLLDRISPDEVYKPEFRVPENLIELMYKQALVWAALPFCPVMPLLAMVGITIVFQAKRIAVLYFSRLPRRPIGIASQTNMFRTMMLSTLALMCIPFTYWMNMRVKCGPHVLPCEIDNDPLNDANCTPTPVASILSWVATLPRGVEVVVNLLQTAGLLWLVIFLLIIYGVLISKRYSAELAQVRDLRSALWQERQDMRKFREVYRIKTGNNISVESAKSYFRVMLQGLSRGAQQPVRDELARLEINDMIALCRIKTESLKLLLEHWLVKYSEVMYPQDINVVLEAQEDFIRSYAQ